jgi:hypothetical protein
MMDPRIVFILAWGAVNGALLTYLGDRLGWGNDLHQALPNIPTVQTTSISVDVLPDFAMPKLDQKYKQTLERPLFVPTRRPAPPPPPPPPPPKPRMAKGQFQLVGMVNAGGKGYALLREINGGKVRYVEAGQTINGIRLGSVRPEGVTLEQYEDVEKIGRAHV